MLEYVPIRRRGGSQKTPWGYYLSPLDATMFLPDKEKLDALHYAFRMRAKHNTPYSMCAQWLHSATGRSITKSGFCMLYQNWLRKIRREKEVQHDKEFKEKISKMQHLNVLLNDTADISAVAALSAREAWKKKEQRSG